MSSLFLPSLGAQHSILIFCFFSFGGQLVENLWFGEQLIEAYCFSCLWYLFRHFFEYLFRVRIPSLWLFYLLRAY